MASLFALGPSLGTVLLTAFVLGDAAALYALSKSRASSLGTASTHLTPGQVDAQARITRALNEELGQFGKITGEAATAAAAAQASIQKQVLDALSEELTAMSAPDLQFEIAWRKGMEKGESLSSAISIAKRTPKVLQREGFLVEFVQSIVDTLTANNFNRNWGQYNEERGQALEEARYRSLIGLPIQTPDDERRRKEERAAAAAERALKGGGTINEARQLVELALVQEQPKGAIQTALKTLVTVPSGTNGVDRLYYVFNAFATFRKNSRDSVFRRSYSPARLGDAETMYDFLNDPNIKVNPAFAKLDADTKFKETRAAQYSQSDAETRLVAVEGKEAELKAEKGFFPGRAAEAEAETSQNEPTQTPEGCPADKAVGKHVSVPGQMAGTIRAGTVVSFVPWDKSKWKEEEVGVGAARWKYGQCHIKILWADTNTEQILDPSNVNPISDDKFKQHAAPASPAPAAPASVNVNATWDSVTDVESRDVMREIDNVFKLLNTPVNTRTPPASRAKLAEEAAKRQPSEIMKVVKRPKFDVYMDRQDPTTGKTLLMFAGEGLMRNVVDALLTKTKDAYKSLSLIDSLRKTVFHYVAAAPETRDDFVQMTIAVNAPKSERAAAAAAEAVAAAEKKLAEDRIQAIATANTIKRKAEDDARKAEDDARNAAVAQKQARRAAAVDAERWSTLTPEQQERETTAKAAVAAEAAAAAAAEAKEAARVETEEAAKAKDAAASAAREQADAARAAEIAATDKAKAKADAVERAKGNLTAARTAFAADKKNKSKQTAVVDAMNALRRAEEAAAADPVAEAAAAKAAAEADAAVMAAENTLASAQAELKRQPGQQNETAVMEATNALAEAQNQAQKLSPAARKARLRENLKNRPAERLEELRRGWQNGTSRRRRGRGRRLTYRKRGGADSDRVYIAKQLLARLTTEQKQTILGMIDHALKTPSEYAAQPLDDKYIGILQPRNMVLQMLFKVSTSATSPMRATPPPRTPATAEEEARAKGTSNLMIPKLPPPPPLPPPPSQLPRTAASNLFQGTYIDVHEALPAPARAEEPSLLTMTTIKKAKEDAAKKVSEWQALAKSAYEKNWIVAGEAAAKAGLAYVALGKAETIPEIDEKKTTALMAEAEAKKAAASARVQAAEAQARWARRRAAEAEAEAEAEVAKAEAAAAVAAVPAPAPAPAPLPPPLAAPPADPLDALVRQVSGLEVSDSPVVQPSVSEPGIPPETLGAIADANRKVVAASEIASAAKEKYSRATIKNKGREARARQASIELRKRTAHMNEMMTQYRQSMGTSGISEERQSGFLKSVDDAIAGVKAQVAVLEKEVDPPEEAGGGRRRHKTPKRRRVRKSTFRRRRKH